MRARDLMTPEPVRLRADATLREALGLLALAEVRHLPVVDGDELVGLLSERDVLGAVPLASVGAHGSWSERPVRELMNPWVYAVEPGATVADVIDEMLARGTGAVLVVEGGHCIGIVSYVDVLEALKHALDDDGEQLTSPRRAPR